MAIIDTLTKGNFVNRLREIRKENFSYKGAEALYEYLEQVSEDQGEPIEFDPIGLCCEYAEYDNFADLQKEYDNINSLDDLEHRTHVIYVSGEKSEDSIIIIEQF